ncbi:MAG: lactate utilization protein [Candidatus Faecousia sp.]|nr:lactate utilization protein [Clostridiales bacterium]MDY4599514.1 lactate utilization protein [Candidatus Faecousia sp.]
MTEQMKTYYEKRAQVLVKNLKSRHFEAYYCPDSASALAKALELIPEGASVGWGGALSAQQIGLIDAVKSGSFAAIDRDAATTPEERTQALKRCLTADVFLCGANALSLDGQMVNIDGTGNRVAAIAYGPDMILVIAGMNKVCDTLEDAVTRARTIAAPMNKQRFPFKTPCEVTGACADCKSEESICNQILITRNCRPAGRIKFVLVGEELGF